MFKEKKILSENEIVAKQLREARESKNLKLEDIAKKININYKYLKALEGRDNEKLPEGIYGKKFLREYASFLGLDCDEIDDILSNKEYDKNNRREIKNKKHSTQKIFLSQRVKGHRFIIVPKIVKIIIFIAVILICFSYLWIGFKNIISPPDLNVINPLKDMIISDNFIDITGETEPKAQITINGEFVLGNKEGLFEKRINLKNGLNTITIISKKKYGREAIVKRQILVE